MRQFLRGAIAGGVGAAVVMVATAAMAGTGIGGVFNLGKSNTVNAQSKLTGNSGSSPQLEIQNTGGGPAFSATVKSGAAPFKVSSTTRVRNLNADEVDGVSATGFLGAHRLLHGAVDANAPAGARLFLDPRTGADIRHFGIGEVLIKNTNAQAHLLITGISTLGNDEEHWSVELGPGESSNFPEQTIEPTFLDLMITRLGASAAGAVSLHLTCNVGDNTATGLVALSCLGTT